MIYWCGGKPISRLLMKKRWFRKWGWIYYPVRLEGWTVVIVCAIFCAQVFMAVDRRSHSVSDTFYGIFPYVVPALGVLIWIASKTSRK